MSLKILRTLVRAAFVRQSDERYLAISKLTNLFYPNFCHTERAKTFLRDKEFLRDYSRFEKNLHSIDRKQTVIQFLKIVRALEGDTVECGAFKGATSYFILKHGDPTRIHHIFDSFKGLSSPESIDGDYWMKGSLSSGESEIRENLKEFQNVRYYPGWIPDRFPEVADRKFRFVHVDVDLYRPTKDSLEFFYGRLVPGGVIICDDYGFDTCPGARKAVDEFVAEHGVEILDLPSGQGVILTRR